MSMRYKGAVISATPPTLSPNAGGSGAWTLEQQMQANAAGLWPKNGPFNYIEDVFSTFLYTGNSASRTITNGVDLAGKGGLTWIKNRTNAGYPHMLYDTVRGATNSLSTNDSAAQLTYADSLTAFNSSGFSLGADTVSGNVNNTGENYASWTFERQAKFFDVVTWTGDGAAQKTIPHNLGSAPGFIMAKSTSDTANWTCYHRSLGEGKYIRINTTAAAVTSANAWININANTFDAYDFINQSGSTYVAYVFAHNAGGFGLSGNENVISCGSCTGNADVNLGYEPQWVMVKRTNSTGDWVMVDNMRGMVVDTTSPCQQLYANSSSAESGNQYSPHPTSTGFYNRWINGTDSFIYIAIRRGPMAVPTTGTSVFSPNLYTEIIPTGTELTAPFPTDLNLVARRNSAQGFYWLDRLRGSTTSNNALLTSFNTSAEFNFGVTTYDFANNTGVKVNFLFNNTAASTVVDYQFRRAPGFFDEVCYTGNDVLRTINHNLGVAPEMMIIKNRTSALEWAVYHAGIGNTKYLFLNSTAAEVTASSYWNNTSPTASVFTVNTSNKVNSDPSPYVAYLFASCPGVSKVGSFTGTGATQVINCGFTGGARFVLIKATSTTGNWLVWDTARGMIPSNDPYLALNSTAAEVTGTDWVDTAATGFELSNAGGNLANSSGVSYIFWAVA
jgi:hypothetical protein